MCKSVQEGGQRCYGHSAEKLENATAALAATAPGTVAHANASAARDSALIALASTKRGAEEIGNRLLTARTPAERSTLTEILKRGQETRAQAQAVRDAYLAARKQDASLTAMGLERTETVDPANGYRTTEVRDAEGLLQDGPNNGPARQIHDASGALIESGHYRNGQLWSPDNGERALFVERPGRRELSHYVNGEMQDLHGEPAMQVFVDGQLSSTRSFDAGHPVDGRDGAPHAIGYHPNGAVKWVTWENRKKEMFTDNGTFTYRDTRTDGAEVTISGEHGRTSIMRTRNGQAHDGTYGEPAYTSVRRDGTLGTVSHYKAGKLHANEEGVFQIDYDMEGKPWDTARSEPNKPVSGGTDSDPLSTLHYRVLTEHAEHAKTVKVARNADGTLATTISRITPETAKDMSFPSSVAGHWVLDYDTELGLTNWERFNTPKEARTRFDTLTAERAHADV